MSVFEVIARIWARGRARRGADAVRLGIAARGYGRITMPSGCERPHSGVRVREKAADELLF